MNAQTKVLIILFLIPGGRSSWWRPGWFRRKATISRDLSMEDLQKLAIDVGADDWCIDRKKRHSEARDRCERGVRALRNLRSSNESDCSCGSTPNCRFVPENGRYECTVLPRSDPYSVACPGLTFSKSKRRLIKFSDCVHAVIATLPSNYEEAELAELSRTWSTTARQQKYLKNFHHSFSLTSQFRPSAITGVGGKNDLKDKIVQNSGRLILIILYAKLCNKWIAMNRGLEDLARRYSAVVFLKHDIDKKLEGLEMYDDSLIPSFTFIVGNKHGTINVDSVKEDLFHTTSIAVVDKLLQKYGAISRTPQLSPQRFMSAPKVPVNQEQTRNP